MAETNEGPVYPSGSAEGLLLELAEAIEQSTSVPTVIVGEDDAKAIRWALSRLFPDA